MKLRLIDMNFTASKQRINLDSVNVSKTVKSNKLNIMKKTLNISLAI